MLEQLSELYMKSEILCDKKGNKTNTKIGQSVYIDTENFIFSCRFLMGFV